MNEKAFLDRLDSLNNIMQQMLDIMPRPGNKFTSVLEIIVLIAGAFGFISIADTIMKWFIGG